MTRDKSAHYAESNAFTDCDAAVTAQSIIGVADTTFMADTPLDDEIQALRTKVLTRALEFGHQDLSSQQDDLSNQQDDLSSQQDDLSSQQDDLSSRHEQRLRDWEQLTLYWTRLCWPQCQKGYAKLGARECDMDTDEMKDLKRQIRVDVQRSMQFFDFHYGLPRSAISERQERLEVILRDLFAAHPQNCNTLNGCREDQVYRVTETDEQCMPNQPPPDDPSSDLTSHSTSHSTSGIDPPSGRSEDSGETESYELQYIQGAHEVCVVFCELNSANVFDSPRFMDFLVNFYLTRLFNLQSRIRFDIGMYQTMAFISELLYRFNPELLKSLILNRHERYRAGWMGDGSELHFTIPWLVTMFAHSIRSFDLLQTIWDMLLVFPPPFAPYFYAAMIEEVFPYLDDLRDNHGALDTYISGEAMLFTVLPRACWWLQNYPYDLLFDAVAERLSEYRDRDTFERFYDARETILKPIRTSSVPPPLWCPSLGRGLQQSRRLIARRIEAKSLRINSATLDEWAHKVNLLKTEWQTVRRSAPTAQRQRRLLTFSLFHMFYNT